MSSVQFEVIYKEVLSKLGNLDKHLTYHCKEHTLDVLEQCERIAAVEGVTDPHSLFLLKTAAMYHDSGFLEGYAHHEDNSCNVFLKDAQMFNFSEEEKAIVVGLIDATRLPQRPNTQLEEIICDADLDYLGRPDFPVTSDGLRREFLHFKIVADNEQWNKLQANFLHNHQYFTASSIALREPVKQQHMKQLPQ